MYINSKLSSGTSSGLIDKNIKTGARVNFFWCTASQQRTAGTHASATFTTHRAGDPDHLLGLMLLPGKSECSYQQVTPSSSDA